MKVAAARRQSVELPPVLPSAVILSKARDEQDRLQAREVFSRVPPGLFSLLAAGDTLGGRIEVYTQPDQRLLS